LPNWIVVIAVLLALTSVLAAPAQNSDPNLTYYDNSRDESGYSFAYKTKDGQYREEQGYVDPDSGILRVTGLYRFEGSDGKTYEYNYEADENGYRIVGKPPPVGAPISNTVLLSLVAVFAFVCLLGVCLAEETSIVSDDKEMNVDGSYKFSYEQSDGQKREEKAELKASSADPEVQAISVSGSYEYTDNNGKRYLVTYTADENGYRPVVKQL
uniref:Uncharacterized protein n=1 Tax=Anopheles minimus TaxID=112268 RepID=A0A182WKK4_9DIPT